MNTKPDPNDAEEIYPDDISDFIEQEMEKIDDDEDEFDPGGFDLPPDDEARELPDVVGVEDGLDLVDDAKSTKLDPKEEVKTPDEIEAEAEAEAEADAKAAKPDEEGDTGEDDTDAAESLENADIGALLNGIDESKSAEISRRIGQAESVMGLFADHQGELSQHGTDEKSAMERLLYLNKFAQDKPDEYLAWVSHQVNAENPREAFEKAAAHMGLKVVSAESDDGDDDMFLDPEVKRLREENKALRAGGAGEGLNFGPDTPKLQAARNVESELTNFVNERDATGNLVRPLFNQLQPQITAKAAARKQETGQPVSTQDLQSFYDEATTEMRAAFGVPESGETAKTADNNNSAAQTASDVSETIKRKAAGAKRAQKASKNIDGSGQGATRRPALSPDEDLASVISHFANNLTD